MTLGLKLSEMDPSATIPAGGYVPFVVPAATPGFSQLANYRYDLGADLLTRVTYTALADDNGSSLVTFTQAGSGMEPRSSESKLRERLTPDDCTGANDTEKWLNFIARLNAIDAPLTGYATRSYSLDSTVLALTPLVITRNNVTIIFEDGASIGISGVGAVPAVIKAENCSAPMFINPVIRGNSVANAGDADGMAIWHELTVGAGAEAIGMTVKGGRFSNFKGPYWIYTLNRSASHKIVMGRITGNVFVSETGNSRNPASASLPADAVNLYGLAGSAGVEGFDVSGNIVNARHIKVGVRLFHVTRRNQVANNIVIDAGIVGANDNGGAYAFMDYSDDVDAASDNVFTDNIAYAPRSIGLYLRGAKARSVVRGMTVTDTTDSDFSALPKGGVIVVGGIDVDISGVSASGVAGYATYFIPSSVTPVVKVSIDGIRASGCFAGTWIAAEGGDIPELSVNDVRAIECQWGVVLATYDGDEITGQISNVRAVSSVANSDGVVVVAIQTERLINSLLISNVFVNTARYGVDVRGMPNVALKKIHTYGDFSANGVAMDACTDLAIDNILFQNMQAGGQAYSAGSAQGIMQGVQFLDVDAAHDINITGTDLGINTPTWATGIGGEVQNLNRTAGGGGGDWLCWVNTTGTTWKTAGPIAA